MTGAVGLKLAAAGPVIPNFGGGGPNSCVRRNAFSSSVSPNVRKERTKSSRGSSRIERPLTGEFLLTDITTVSES